MRIILNMSHARCLFAQHVYTAQLTPCVLQKALPFSPTTINRIFKAVPVLRGEKNLQVQRAAPISWLLLVPSTKKSNPKGWTSLCGSEPVPGMSA